MTRFCQVEDCEEEGVKISGGIWRCLPHYEARITRVAGGGTPAAFQPTAGPKVERAPRPAPAPKVARAPVVSQPQKPPPAPVVAPIQAAAVVAVETKPEPVREPPKPKEPRILAPFEINPDAPPGRCRRVGCKFPLHTVSRGLCKPDSEAAVRRGIFEAVALPKPPPKEVPLKKAKEPHKFGGERIVAFVAENPGCTHEECATATGLSVAYVMSKVSALRGDNLLAPVSPRWAASCGHLYPIGYDVPMLAGSLQAKILEYIGAHPGCTARDIDSAIPGHKAGESVSIMRKTGLLPPAFDRGHRLFGRLFLHTQNPEACKLRPIKRKQPPPPTVSYARTLEIVRNSGALGTSQVAIATELKVDRSHVRRVLKTLVESGDIMQHPSTRRYLSTTKG